MIQFNLIKREIAMAVVGTVLIACQASLANAGGDEFLAEIAKMQGRLSQGQSVSSTELNKAKSAFSTLNLSTLNFVEKAKVASELASLIITSKRHEDAFTVIQTLGIQGNFPELEEVLKHKSMQATSPSPESHFVGVTTAPFGATASQLGISKIVHHTDNLKETGRISSDPSGHPNFIPADQAPMSISASDISLLSPYDINKTQLPVGKGLRTFAKKNDSQVGKGILSTIMSHAYPVVMKLRPDAVNGKDFSVIHRHAYENLDDTVIPTYQDNSYRVIVHNPHAATIVPTWYSKLAKIRAKFFSLEGAPTRIEDEDNAIDYDSLPRHPSWESGAPEITLRTPQVFSGSVKYLTPNRATASSFQPEPNGNSMSAASAGTSAISSNGLDLLTHTSP